MPREGDARVRYTSAMMTDLGWKDISSSPCLSPDLRGLGALTQSRRWPGARMSQNFRDQYAIVADGRDADKLLMGLLAVGVENTQQMGNTELTSGEQDALGVIDKQGPGWIKLQLLMQCLPAGLVFLGGTKLMGGIEAIQILIQCRALNFQRQTIRMGIGK